MTTMRRRSVLSVLGMTAASGCVFGDQSRPDEASLTTRGGGTDEIHVLTDLGSEPWRRKWNDEIVPAFAAQSEYSLNVEIPPHKRPRLRELHQSGNLPEICTATNHEISRYITEGETQAVGDIVAELEETNGELILERPISTDETTHLVPHGLKLGGVLNYRADIYDALDLSVPRTWSRLIENARAIEESEQTNAHGFAVAANRSDEKARDDFLNVLYSSGGRVWKWHDREAGVAELALGRERVHAAMETMATLADYSPDPAETSYTTTAGQWVQGNVAQCFFPNAWLAGLAYDGQSEASQRIATNTRQAPVPRWESTTDPSVRGWASVLGTPLFDRTDTTATSEFIRYMYGGRAEQADKNNLTMEYLPPYDGILETPEYQDYEIYRAEGGVFLDRERELLEEIADGHRGNLAQTPATWFAMARRRSEPSVLTDFVHRVLVAERSPEAALDDARTSLEHRHDSELTE